MSPEDAERAFDATFGPGAWDEAAHTPIYPCVLCGASPDLGQAHDPTCPTQHVPGTVYDGYDDVRATRANVHEKTLTLGAWASVGGLLALAVLLVCLIAAFKDDDHCVTRMASDGSPVSVCTRTTP